MILKAHLCTEIMSDPKIVPDYTGSTLIPIFSIEARVSDCWIKGLVFWKSAISKNRYMITLLS